jgi:hypothetical protein
MRDRLTLPLVGLVSTLVILSVGFLFLGRQREPESLRPLSLAHSQTPSSTEQVQSCPPPDMFHWTKEGHGAQDLCGDGLWSVLSFSDFLFVLLLPRRLRAIWGDGLDSTCVLHPHCSGRLYCSIGVDDNLPCLDRNFEKHVRIARWTLRFGSTCP